MLLTIKKNLGAGHGSIPSWFHPLWFHPQLPRHTAQSNNHPDFPAGDGDEVSCEGLFPHFDNVMSCVWG